MGPAELSPNTVDRRLNVHPQERFDALERLLSDGSGPSVVLLVGESGSGREDFTRAAAHLLSEPREPVHLLTLDFEGYSEEGSLESYLKHQARKRESTSGRPPEDVQDVVISAGEAAAGASTGPLALVLGALLGLAKPVRFLSRYQTEPGLPGPEWSPREMVADLLDELDGRVLFHLRDPAVMPTVDSAKSLWRWLPEVVEARDGVLLLISCASEDEVEDLLTVRRGTESLGFPPLEASQVRHELDRVSDRLGEIGNPEGRNVRNFLCDAALCGGLIPVRPLLASHGLVGERIGEIEDLIDEVLVEELGLFDDLEYSVGTFPSQGKAAVYLYRFRDRLLQRALIDQMDREETRERALRLSRFFEPRLPATSRDVARLFLDLAEHLDEARRDRWRQRLGWWVGMDEAEALQAALVKELREDSVDPALVWLVAANARGWPAYRRLAFLDALMSEVEVPADRLPAVLGLRSDLVSGRD